MAASIALVVWAGTRPSFDAYGWLVWGHQTIAGSLDTNAAPSWKPLAYVFTVPYALFGHYQMWLWMITSVAVSLGGALAAGRIAYRLTVGHRANAGASAPGTRAWSGSLRDRRWAGLVAGVFAAAALLEIQGWWHYMLSAQSDTMVVALFLGAVDRHLSGHPRAAFVLGSLAALGRPEVWPFLAAYSIWAWRAIPAMRWVIGAGIAAIVLLWFGVPALTSRSAFVSASNAFGSGRRLRSNQIFGTIQRFLALHEPSLEIAALVGVGWAALRRDRAVLVLAGGVVAWVAIEVAFALHGWPGLGRYMYGAAGLMVVIAAVLVGWLLAGSGSLVSGRLHSDRSALAFPWLGVVLVALLIASLVPAAVSRTRVESRDLHAQRIRTKEINRLASVVDELGGPSRLRACGEPLTSLEYQTVLAWTLKRNVSAVGFKYLKAIRRGNPAVFFTPLPAGGWHVHAQHQRVAACSSLPR